MLVNFNESYITVFAANLSHLQQYFYLLDYKTLGMLLGHATTTGVQNQKQGHPCATRMHCRQMGKAGSVHHRQSH